MYSMRDQNAVIYSDSDGVICDFMAGTQKILGHPFNEDGKSCGEDGALLNASWNFWETLPPMPDFHIYWEVLRKYDPHILTAVPNMPWEFETQEVDRGKRKWYRDHLPTIPQRNIHVVKREQKRDFAQNGKVRNILIDDHAENVQEFERAGGIGVLHHSARTTIIKLKELGYY